MQNVEYYYLLYQGSFFFLSVEIKLSFVMLSPGFARFFFDSSLSVELHQQSTIEWACKVLEQEDTSLLRLLSESGLIVEFTNNILNNILDGIKW